MQPVNPKLLVHTDKIVSSNSLPWKTSYRFFLKAILTSKITVIMKDINGVFFLTEKEKPFEANYYFRFLLDLFGFHLALEPSICGSLLNI